MKAPTLPWNQYQIFIDIFMRNIQEKIGFVNMNVIVFGAGNNLLELMQEAMEQGDHILAIVDNDPLKYGKEMMCLGHVFTIQHPEHTNLDCDAIIISLEHVIYQYEIVSQLLKMGIPKEKIFTWFSGNFVLLPVVSNWEGIKANRILFSVSDITAKDRGTGISRMVNSLYVNMKEKLQDSFIPVRWFGEIITSQKYHYRRFKEPDDGKEYQINLTGTDKLLLADQAWPDLKLVLNEAQRCRTPVYAFVYDLIPIKHPEVYLEKFSRDFVDYMLAIMKMSDSIICISRAVADDIASYYESQEIERDTPLNLYYIHLGFDIKTTSGTVRKEIKNFVNSGKTFLMVGTVEPKKNHLLALKAMKECFVKFPELRLLILGHDGWDNQEFKHMMRVEPSISGKVLWVKDASDAEVQWSYRNCQALLFPSADEGFGLPLVEAAYFGLPILCSNTPVFREVAGEFATYFSPGDERNLERTIVEWMGTSVHPDSSRIHLYSWNQCSQEVIDILEGNVLPYRVLR